MSWVKLDDHFPEHDKVSCLHDRTFRLHVIALCYCARNLTDGFLSAKSVRVCQAVLDASSVRRYVKELVAAGLWVEVGDGDYTIKDYLKYNPTAAEVKDIREKRREAGRKGGERSGASRRASPSFEAHAKANASKQKGSNGFEAQGVQAQGVEPRPVPSRKPKAVTRDNPENGLGFDITSILKEVA